MIGNGLDYDKTVTSNKMMFKGKLFQRIISIIYIIGAFAFGIIISYLISSSLINYNSSIFDYLLSVLIPIVLLIFVAYGCYNIFNRDKLREISININCEDAKQKLIKAARNLNWKTDEVRNNYIVIKTNYEFIKDCQTVTLILFPNNKIYFNSVHFPNDFIRPARFEDNYRLLVNEYKIIEYE
jgi:uncharacterized protein YacL